MLQQILRLLIIKSGQMVRAAALRHHELLTALRDLHQLAEIIRICRCRNVYQVLIWLWWCLFEVFGDARLVDVHELGFVFVVEGDLAVEHTAAELDHCGQFGHLESVLDHVPPNAVHSGDLADLLTTCRRLQLV